MDLRHQHGDGDLSVWGYHGELEVILSLRVDQAVSWTLEKIRMGVNGCGKAWVLEGRRSMRTGEKAEA